MFAIFAVLGWIIIMAAVIVVAAMTALGMYLNISLHTIMTTGKGQAKVPGLEKIANNKIVHFLNTNLYGDNKVTKVFFGDGNPQTLNTFQMWIWPILIIVASLFIFLVAIAELHRLKKSQKVSKPFVKIILVSTLALDLVLGKNLSVIAGGAIFLGLVLLEIVLFDTDALNNFAEERNLVSIYREEKKFEREVNKEGKVNWQHRFGNVRGQKGKKYKYVGPRWESKNKW